MHETVGTGSAVEDGRAEPGAARAARPALLGCPPQARAAGAEPSHAAAVPHGAAPGAAVPFQGGVLRPDGLHDLRRRSVPTVLRYPAGDLVAVTGLPGSGKSTLMRRCARAPLVDSQLVRERYEQRLPLLPYALYRPLVRLEHYRGLRRAVEAGGPLVVHDCGSVPWVRDWLARTAARQGRRLHLILLDATAEQAADGQRARGREVSRYAFLRHRRATARLRAQLAAAGGPAGDCASTVLLDRSGARRIRSVEFG